MLHVQIMSGAHSNVQDLQDPLNHAASMPFTLCDGLF